MASPRVSIIIPCYNAGQLLAECLDGVLAQEYENKEVIIVDGASADGTVEIAGRYAAEHACIRWVSERDRGVYDAMNKGVGMATGEWVYFLGADDRLYDPLVLAGIFGGGQDAGQDILYGDVEFKYSKRVYDGRYDLRRILFESNICHQAVFYRRSVFERVGLYDIECRVYADRDFNIRCFLDKGLRIKYLEKIVAVYNEQDGLSALQRADPHFRGKQEKYIREFNKKPIRAVALSIRRLAGWVKTTIHQDRENG
ncbi:MAG TPA: glycosyltransferase family 2 protein [Puia sp.]|nr:glycosyltransferase family 2 protein [Puia sp.]